MKFVLHRDYVLSSTLGHSIRFEKGVAIEIPKLLWPEAVAIGALPENEAAYEQEKKGPEVPNDPGVRRGKIFTAFEQILSKGDRESFTAGGAPHIKTINKLVGFSVTNKERDDAWVAFKQADEE